MTLDVGITPRLPSPRFGWGGADVFDDRPIIGHIRFSYYGYTDTRLKPDADDAALALLYDETRMARRFFLFEQLTLPSLRAQTDQNFHILIMSSDAMPEVYKQRLRRVTARLPQVRIVFSKMRRSLFAYKRFMMEALGPDQSGTAVHFRLDDDDALARSYIRRLRSATHGMATTTHFTFPKGILLFPAQPGDTEGTSLVVKEFLTAQGLAYVSDKGFLRNPFNMMHRMIWQDLPVVSDPGFLCYIRALHFNNDTAARHDHILAGYRATRQGDKAVQLGEEVTAALAEEFPFIDRPRLDALLAELALITRMDDLPPPV